MNDALDLSACQVFDVYVVLFHVGDSGRLGIEFGVHQAGFRCIPAQLLELAGRAVEEPVVSARIGTPYAPGIRENQNALVVLGPTEARDLQGLLCACRGELRGRDQHLAILARRGVVLYQVTPSPAPDRRRT